MLSHVTLALQCGHVRQSHFQTMGHVSCLRSKPWEVRIAVSCPAESRAYAAELCRQWKVSNTFNVDCKCLDGLQSTARLASEAAVMAVMTAKAENADTIDFLYIHGSENNDQQMFAFPMLARAVQQELGRDVSIRMSWVPLKKFGEIISNLAISLVQAALSFQALTCFDIVCLETYQATISRRSAGLVG